MMLCKRRLESESGYLCQEVKEAPGNHELLGLSAGSRRVLEQIETVAPTDATVLILGETGVGKELVARAIHASSLRCDRPWVKINCTAIPRELFESELFGHIRGAFSGAVTDRVGRFQLADGGTLFLDEIGDLPPEMQPKLLGFSRTGNLSRSVLTGRGALTYASSRPLIATSKARSARDVSAKTFTIG